MAGYYGEDLQRTAGNVGGSYLRDFTHAAKIFRPAGYDLAPKFKFLFHTYFDINPIAYDRNVGTGDNFGVLVKSVKLPSFSIKTHEMNQYNRKRIVQTKINYDPVNITFHDDNINTITKLWDAYYTYYYKDATNLNGIFRGDRGSSAATSEAGNGATNQTYNNRTLYDKDLTGQLNWGYVGDSFNSESLVKVPFFRNITVFGFNRHKFTAYSLINPMITKFDHDTYNYAEGGGTMELKMDLSYETVAYNEGVMDSESPDSIVQGFGLSSFYDLTPSPITPPAAWSTAPGKNGYNNPTGGYVNSVTTPRATT